MVVSFSELDLGFVPLAIDQRRLKSQFIGEMKLEQNALKGV